MMDNGKKFQKNQCSLQVLDIGVGSYPWLYWITQGKHRESQTIKNWEDAGFDLITMYENIKIYIGIEKNKKQITQNELVSKTHIIHGDATKLPFKNNAFDLIILSNVLSSPSWPECSCSEKNCALDGEGKCAEDECEISFRCAIATYPITETEKNKIIDETVRVLDIEGHIIISDTSTTRNGSKSYEKIRILCKNGILKLQFIDDMFNRGYFQKMPHGYIPQNDLHNSWQPDDRSWQFLI